MKRFSIQIGTTIFYVYAEDEDTACTKLLDSAKVEEVPISGEIINVIDQRKAPGA